MAKNTMGQQLRDTVQQLRAIVERLESDEGFKK